MVLRQEELGKSVISGRKSGRASALEIRQGVFTAVYQDRQDVLSGAPAEAPAR